MMRFGFIAATLALVDVAAPTRRDAMADLVN